MQQKKDQKQQTSSQTLINFLPIIGIVLLAIIILIGYMFFYRNANQEKSTSSGPTILPTETSTPINDPYADWRTYRNEELGFEFKYPSEWGETTVSIGKGGLGGKQLRGILAQGEVYFGGNSSDYKIDPSYQGGGATFYDFYKFIYDKDDRYKIEFARNKFHTVISEEKLVISSYVETIIIFNQMVDQIFDNNSRVAYVNLFSENIKQGLAFRYRNIPDNEILNFDNVIKSIKLIR